jgi:hypothetical protein
MKLSVTEASAKVRVTRQTLYKMHKAGKLSFEKDAKGNHTIDTAELFRCFPPVAMATNQATDVNTRLEDENRRLLDQICEYRDRERQHLEHINQLTRLLEHRPAQAAPEPHQDQPRRGFWGRIFGGAK